VSAPERITYLARRHPSFSTRAEWVPRWREHWALAASQPESATVRRYAQGEVLLDAAEPRHDGMAYAEYVSPEARLRNRAAQGYHSIMSADEAVVFDQLILGCSFFGTHHLLAGDVSAPFAVVRFVRRAWVGQDFALTWERWAEPWSTLPHGMRGIAQTRALPAPPDGWGLDVDGCEEYRFATLGAARMFFEGVELAQRTAEAPFVVTDAVMVHDVVLKDG